MGSTESTGTTEINENLESEASPKLGNSLSNPVMTYITIRTN